MTHDIHLQVSPAVARLVDTYLSAAEQRLRAEDPQSRTETLEALASHIAEHVDESTTPDEARALLEQLGLPEGDAEPARADETASGAASGRVLGIPYDLRVPTAGRIAARWWNPADPRFFVPRVWGIGWSLNFGAVAVSLRLIEPDAEDLPFASTPQATLVAALGVPVALVVAMLGSLVALRAQLPPAVPAHWDLAGRADQLWPTPTAFGFLLLMALVPTVIALATVARRAPRPRQGAWISAATLFASLAAAIWLLTLISTFTQFAAWWLPPLLIVGALAATFLVLLWLARAGRRAEIVRDLSTKGVAS